ncbi:unnamed protein product [Closterium sp. NIES-64]|nr:unnamed protein product [Closterium sp. NIES-65]CAI5979355.1 unnamed protein product [Closterium sp. NIES-64]
MVPIRSGSPSLPLLVLLSLLIVSSSPPHSPCSATRAAAIGAQLPPASVPPVTRNRDANSTSVYTPLPRAWHPPLIFRLTHAVRSLPRQHHVFGRKSGRPVEAAEVFSQPADGEAPASAAHGRSLEASTAASGAGAGECDAEWMLLWPAAQECWLPRMTTAQGGTSARVASAASSSAHLQATAQSLTSVGVVIAQASAPPPPPPDDRPDEGDGGSTPPAGNEARLTPDNEIIGVCRTGATSTITIAPDWNGQTWRGWGTSLAWFANYVGKLPDDQFNLIMDLLFDKDKGIGLNLARYLIGGSVNYTNSPQFLTAAWETRSLPGFRVRPNGPYDWTADGRQRRTMLAALARNVDEVEAISYSPPWWMTVSGDTAGTEQGKCNLKPEYFQAYSDYQASVIEHYRRYWNVTFSTMNPSNEALEGWWSQGSKNEGCNYSPEQLSTLIRLLTANLKKRKLPTKVAGFDSFVGATLRYTYKFPAAVKAGLFRLNVHGYIPPPPNTTDTRRYMEGVMVGMHRMATGLGKEVWMSEVGPMWVVGNDVGVMLFTARQIVQAVNIMGASAWIFWQAVSGVATNPDAFLKWGLLAIRIYRLNDTEVKPLDLVISKKLYMLQQFVRGAPRGSLPLRIDTSGGCQHCIAAFFHPDQHSVSIFIVNQRDTPHTATFQFEKFEPFDAGQECVLETYRTSATENNTLVATQSYSDVPASIQVAALGSSMTSVVLRNVDPT